MTLMELSVHYTSSADALRGRILELRRAASAQTDPLEARRLRQRIDTLVPLLREMRELSALTSHYYDRSYHKHEFYTL